jgi:hypothetical protein
MKEGVGIELMRQLQRPTSYSTCDTTVIEHALGCGCFPLSILANIGNLKFIKLTASIWAIMPIFRVLLISALCPELRLLELLEKARKRQTLVRLDLSRDDRHDTWVTLEQ